MKRFICLMIALALIIPFSGCAVKKTSEKGKVTISIGTWPNKDAKPEEYNRKMDLVKRFNEKYPNINIVGDEWNFTVDTFLPKAASNQLPSVFYVPFTEVNKLIEAGYVADITKYMKEYGYTDNLTDEILNLVTKNGKIYMVPYGTYALGILANRELFEKAGELDSSGNIKFPKTFEEMGELAGRIKAKTGQAGYILPTLKNGGGWHFMNIAWAYGTEFMKKENNKWIATFNSPECEAALQFIKDLKWKYNALSDNIFIDNAEGKKMLATNQGAMYFSSVSEGIFKDLIVQNGMNRNSISAGLMPAGPAGRYTLMGGSLYAIPSNASSDEIDAVFKWLEFTGYAPVLTEEAKLSKEQEFLTYVEDGNLILGEQPFNVWKSGNVIDYTNELRVKYGNANINYFKDYMNFKDITIKPEEPVNCQELYSLLDGCIQEVLTKKDSDVKLLLEGAANNFQINYLNNVQ